MRLLTLLDLPRDAILRILYLLDVRDLLAVERTSHTLRDIVQARHLWLVHLCGLDQVRAPNLHPSVDISQLSTGAVRSLVVKAVHSYHSCTRATPKGSQPICSYALEKTIFPFGTESAIVLRPHGQQRLAKYEIDNAKLLPGGRYLLIVDTQNIHNRFSWIKSFRVLDLHNDNKEAWSYSPVTELEPEEPSFVDFDDFAYDIAPDGSILLILRVYDLWVGQRDVQSVCKIVHLTRDPEDEAGPLLCHMVHYSRDHGIHHDFGMSITDKYAVIIDFEKLKIVTWETGMTDGGSILVKKARSCTLTLSRGHYQELRVIHNHLVYADDVGNICAFSLLEAFALAESHGFDCGLDLEDLPISRLSITGSEAIVKFACYQPPSTNIASKPTSPVELSILTFTEREDDLRLICTYVQVTFDPILSGPYKFRLIRTSNPQEVPLNYLTSYSNMTAQGRVMVVSSETSNRKASLGVITQEGEVVSVELSKEARDAFRGNASFEYPFIEEYSGKIVVARVDEQERARVDIFALL